MNNQCPFNEMISTDDTGCHNDSRTHYFEVAGLKITESVDSTMEMLSAHFFPVEP